MNKNFMLQAIEEAKKAYSLNEVPIGAVLVYQGNIIAKAHNLVETLNDATAHAEMLCLKKAYEYMGDWRLNECTLYCTLEPCIQCAGALILSRVKTLVWGAKDLRHGANGSFIDVFKDKHPIHQIEIVSGVCEDLCANLLKQFFKEVRVSN